MDVVKPRIVFVCGIATTDFMLDSLSVFLSDRYPDREIIFISSLYVYTEHKKIISIQGELLDLLSDGEPTILVGHSFGGILAISTCQKYSQMTSGVIKIVTLGTPHSIDGFGVAKAKKILGYSHQPLSCQVLTVGARQDVVVLDKHSSFVQDTHLTIQGKHTDFLYPENPWIDDFWNQVI